MDIKDSLRTFLDRHKQVRGLRPSRRGLASGLPLYERPSSEPEVSLTLLTTRPATDLRLTDLIDQLASELGHVETAKAPEALCDLVTRNLDVRGDEEFSPSGPGWSDVWSDRHEGVRVVVADRLGAGWAPDHFERNPTFLVVLDGPAPPGADDQFSDVEVISPDQRVDVERLFERVGLDLVEMALEDEDPLTFFTGWPSEELLSELNDIRSEAGLPPLKVESDASPTECQEVASAALVEATQKLGLQTPRKPPTPEKRARSLAKSLGGPPRGLSNTRPCKAGPGVLHWSDGPVITAIEYVPPTRPDYGALGVWIALQSHFERVNRGRKFKDWAEFHGAQSGPTKLVYYARSESGKRVWNDGELTRFLATLEAQGLQQVELYFVDGFQLPPAGPVPLSPRNLKDVQRWNTLSSKLFGASPSNVPRLDGLRQDLEPGVQGSLRYRPEESGECILFSGPREVGEAASGLVIDGGLVSRVEAGQIVSEARETMRARTKGLSENKATLPTTESANEAVRAWPDYLVWPLAADQRVLPDQRPDATSAIPVPDEWRLDPSTSDDRRVFWVDETMPSRWRLSVRTAFSRPTARDESHVIGDFLLVGAWQDVVKLRLGRSYDTAARAVQLANARCFLEGLPLPLDQRAYAGIEAIALLPDAKPPTATKRYGAFVETARMAGVNAYPLPQKVVFGAQQPQASRKRGQVATRLSTFLTTLLDAGLLPGTPSRDFIRPPKASVFPKKGDLDTTEDKIQALTAELWIDACLYILAQEFVSLSGPAVVAAPGSAQAAAGTAANAAAPISDSSDASGSVTEDEQQEEALEGEEEEDDPVREAIRTLWDVIVEPPEDKERPDEGGDLGDTPAPIEDREPEPAPEFPPPGTSLPPLSDPCKEVPEQEREMFGGSYLTFRIAQPGWGIRIDAARTFGKAARVLAAVEEEGDDAAKALGYPATMHPLHKWASDVLATLFHEWYHHLEDLLLAELELLGVPNAATGFDSWYRKKQGVRQNRNEELAEAYSFDHLFWLLNLDRDFPKKPLEYRHWRDQQLRRSGLEVSELPQSSSVRLAVRATEHESRTNMRPYSDFDQHRRAEPEWGFTWMPPRTGSLPTMEPTSVDRKAGPPSLNSPFWKGVDQVFRQVAVFSKWPGPFRPGYFAGLLAGAEESYALTFNSRVPVRFRQHGRYPQDALLRAIATLGQKHRAGDWGVPGR